MLSIYYTLWGLVSAYSNQYIYSPQRKHVLNPLLLKLIGVKRNTFDKKLKYYSINTLINNYK